jgi:hypothetical protein
MPSREATFSSPSADQKGDVTQAPGEQPGSVVETFLDGIADEMPSEPTAVANTNTPPLYELADKRLKNMYLTKGFSI